MSNKKGKLPILNGPKVERTITVVSPQRAVIATENPIQRWDEDTKQVVNEVLLMDGIVLRGGRDQVPIVDSHNDKTVRNIFGSIQHMQVDAVNGELYGTPVFASDAESQTISQRMAEGHITDFSITGQPLETLYVQRGQSYTTPRGAIIDGPALIHTKWQPQNASICATGADEQSTVRRSYTDLKRTVTRMNPDLLAQLTAMGLPDGLTDPDHVLAWVVGKLGENATEEAAEPAPAPVTNAVPDPKAPVGDEKQPMGVVEKMATEDPAVAVARKAESLNQIKRALDTDQARRKEIQAACTLAKVERAFADELCDKFVPLSEARKRIIERMATQPLGASVGADVRVTQSADDKFYAAARDGLLMRAQQSSRIKRSLFSDDKPADGAKDFAQLSLNRLAMAFLQKMNAPVERMSNNDIAQAAMGNERVLQKYRVQRSDFSAYHTIGSFSNLMLDAANKTLLAGYEEAPYTWNMWARQASSVEDFKNINRIRFSEAPNPEAVPEGKDYPEKVMSDSKETYSVVKYGESFSISWETVIGDDLDAISRIPTMHGNAMRRLQNKKVYEVLTSNPTMGDTYALFSASHTSGDNTSGAAAAPSVTTLNAGFVKMMLQKGLASDAILNIQPRYLIVPVAYSATALQLVASLSDPLAGGSTTTGNSNTLNIYGPNGVRPLQVIAEPQLDSNSSTTWYLAADSGQIDTVELAFLQGEESPVLESEWNMKNDTWFYKIRQTFGVKAIDWRGLYRNS